MAIDDKEIKTGTGPLPELGTALTYDFISLMGPERKRKDHNQDSQVYTPKTNTFVVADGMGGAGGDPRLASWTTANSFNDVLGEKSMSFFEFERAANVAFWKAYDNVVAENLGNTTLAAIQVVEKDSQILIHSVTIGDCLLYSINSDGSTKLLNKPYNLGYQLFRGYPTVYDFINEALDTIVTEADYKKLNPKFRQLLENEMSAADILQAEENLKAILGESAHLDLETFLNHRNLTEGLVSGTSAPLVEEITLDPDCIALILTTDGLDILPKGQREAIFKRNLDKPNLAQAIKEDLVKAVQPEIADDTTFFVIALPRRQKSN